MVADGFTLTGVPLVTPIFPGVMTPVPFENVAVRPDEFPAVMVAGDDTKLAIEGVATTVTVAVDVTTVPVGPVTVSVYVVVAEGVMLTGVPLMTAILPGVMTPVPFVNMAARLDEAPVVMVAGEGAKLAIDGVVETWPLIDPPQPSKPPSPARKASVTAATTPECFMTSPTPGNYRIYNAGDGKEATNVCGNSFLSRFNAVW